MKIEFYNPSEEKNGCVFRSISKALNKDYEIVKEDILNISSNYLDEKVFEKYILNNGFTIDESYNGKMLFDCSFSGANLVFTYRDDWYHMICIIDNVIYDRVSIDDLKDLKVIKTYKKI